MLTDAERAQLAKRLRGDRAAGAGRIPRRPAGLAELPLSYGQEQLWFIDRFAPGLATYNLPFGIRLAGPLDAAALGRAVTGLLARHEALRTRLVPGVGGRPAQVIDLPPTSASLSTARLDLADLSGLAPAGPAALAELVAAESARPFELAGGPLVRLRLVRMGGEEHVLLAVVHHAVFDGWSIGVFLRELAALYRQEAGHGPSGLDQPPLQFADYALWERDRLQGSVLARLDAYWRKVLDGYPTVQFPADRPRPALDTFDGGLAHRMIGAGLLDGLRQLSRREGSTPFAALLAGLVALLHRYTGQDDLVIGTVSANRGRRELQSVIGFLVNALPVRADASGDPPFTELLARVTEASTGAFAHQDLPFARMVDALEVKRDPSRAPVFQISLTYNERDDAPVTVAGVHFSPVIAEMAVGISAAKFDLDFGAEARDDGLWLECSYKTALFDSGTIERLLDHLELLLAGLVADPSAPLSRLPLLTEAERQAELAGWNPAAPAVRAGCVHEAFQAQAARSPAAVAAESGSQRLSYAELSAQASQIARRLRQLGVGPGVLVGVCMGPGLDRLAGLLGIWKAGGGYVPLDPGLPARRLSFMIADTGMSVIVTEAAHRASVPPGAPAAVVCLDAERELIAGLDDTDLAGTGVRPADTAYVIYTSGSTGEPKGVAVEHRQAAGFLAAVAEHWQAGPSDVVLQFAPFTFDVSVLDTFMPLLAGAEVVLTPLSARQSPPRLAALVGEAGVTILSLPPAVLSLLPAEDFPALRLLVVAGEELPSELARRWLRPGLRLVNGYGPTEATVLATWQEIGADALPPPIGLPLPNCRAYVLDARLNPVPAGVTGELHLGGAGLARGYLNRPGLTAGRFIADPLGRPGGRLYRTGDLVRRRADGTIMFLGRADGQVKIRGLRVELGEIEAALEAHPGVAQAVVTVAAGPGGDRRLAGYLRPGRDGGPGLAEVREYLAARLPEYMVPAFLTVVDGFALNASGKVDRGALPAPQAAAAPSGQVAPATMIEAVLADMFARLLEAEAVGATDSFFDVGGSSLQAMLLAGLMDAELEVGVGVAEVFLAPTPRQLAALLRDKYGMEDVDLDGSADGAGPRGEGTGGPAVPVAAPPGGEQ